MPVVLMMVSGVVAALAGTWRPLDVGGDLMWGGELQWEPFTVVAAWDGTTVGRRYCSLACSRSALL